MLQVTLNYSGEQPIFETLRDLHFKYINGSYILNDKNLMYNLEINNNAKDKKLIMQFSKELSFDHYKQIHKIIKIITEKIEVIGVDDSLASMGYLENGEEAFIYHGWSSWVQFLESAKHVSMEGQKVQVYNEQLLVAEGILIEANKDEVANEDFRIVQCTVITKQGEKSIMGENLRIIPTGEF